MNGYQAGIKKFTDTNSVVFGVSTDDLETNKKFAESLKLEFALLSDTSGDASKKFGIYNAERNMSNRTTFVIGKNGKIEHVEAGGGAIDIAGAASACSRIGE
jgi:peroxiredoxin Q/BCP